MSAFEKLFKKEDISQLGLAVLWYGDEQTLAEDDLSGGDAEQAASELAAYEELKQAVMAHIKWLNKRGQTAPKLAAALEKLNAFSPEVE